MKDDKYYKVLGVSQDASEEDIKKSYRKLAKQCHPDLHPDDPEAEQKFKDLTEAYDTLSDPQKRKLYDTYGETSASGGWDTYGNNPFSHFNDIFGGFGDIFGGGFGRAPEPRGEDIAINLTISFKEAVLGCQKTIKISQKKKCTACGGNGSENGTSLSMCEQCHGSGIIQTEQASPIGIIRTSHPCPNCGGTGHKINNKCTKCDGKGFVTQPLQKNVKIPSGIFSNQKLKLSGCGNDGSTGVAGDLYIVITVLPDELFRRDAQDIIGEVPIDLSTALFGGKVKIRTIHGEEEIYVPKQSQPGDRVVIDGKGVINNTTGAKGNHIALLKVIIPSIDPVHLQKIEEMNLNYPEIKKYSEQTQKW